jgi:hypothetical protein
MAVGFLHDNDRVSQVSCRPLPSRLVEGEDRLECRAAMACIAAPLKRPASYRDKGSRASLRDRSTCGKLSAEDQVDSRAARR